MNIFNIIIIGAGHSGIEAAISASKICNKIKIITSNLENLGIMSCNPSIGGIGKSHLVKELELFGGIMPEASDYSRIHSKLLNYKKGESVHSLRYQIDRILYKNYILKILFLKKNILIEQNEINKIIRFKKKILIFNKLKFFNIAKIIIVCAGTFINSKIYIGKNIKALNKAEKKSISYSFKKINLFISKLKTGTPPRLDLNYLNYKKLSVQYSDYTISYGKNFNFNNNVKCFITNTDNKINNFIKKNIKNSSLFNLKFKSIGPRYCPSIEDKIFKFPNNKNHQIFLEPESYFSKEIYVNGLSNSLSYNIQKKLIKKILGIKKSYIIRYAYNIQYDYFDPRCLKISLNIKFANNIFLAGQINGTTGYEEASSQGFVAGINSARKILKLPLWKPKKWNSYIGVLLYDLTNFGIQEPYRIFTSKSDNRLFLRFDNAIFRLINISYYLGCLPIVKFKYYNSLIYKFYKNLINIRKIKLFDNFYLFKLIIIMSKYYGYIKKKYFK
ncbi:glucose inhibited division protein A [Candidatus Carsonella ruddii PV]|uniref:tRNA uridine 5-carboxymethylaminomethyl modification enzyme MnmG n=2 Tax=Carsonella ruddii TaxID=114186 RepID=MNMG_CARRP|nr:FAD-dependent oxidoreductase [Candidatus Carsonella ruddii]Q05FY8.1 RecName: Full=tRNA uridine 5-carboxymethylaminomethyl modification enzyme MnmG; AltName: Full=Glucose-inhibited division protein A [Candidatus Carsonella ruddii PV]BAF35033.1 glucose inhibited division protein A [Candidatus Carsonella ruddii PV]